jgi:hypothetical protein
MFPLIVQSSYVPAVLSDEVIASAAAAKTSDHGGSLLDSFDDWLIRKRYIAAPALAALAAAAMVWALSRIPAQDLRGFFPF